MFQEVPSILDSKIILIGDEDYKDKPMSFWKKMIAEADLNKDGKVIADGFLLDLILFRSIIMNFLL